MEFCHAEDTLFDLHSFAYVLSLALAAVLHPMKPYLTKLKSDLTHLNMEPIFHCCLQLVDLTPRIIELCALNAQ